MKQSLLRKSNLETLEFKDAEAVEHYLGLSNNIKNYKIQWEESRQPLASIIANIDEIYAVKPLGKSESAEIVRRIKSGAEGKWLNLSVQKPDLRFDVSITNVGGYLLQLRTIVQADTVVHQPHATVYDSVEVYQSELVENLINNVGEEFLMDKIFLV